MSATHRLTLKQACELLGKKERTVRRYVQTGLLSKIYVDGENGWELRLNEEEVRSLASGVRPATAAAREDPDEDSEPTPVGYAAVEGVRMTEAAPVYDPRPAAGEWAGVENGSFGENGDTGREILEARTVRALRRRDDPGDLRLDAAFGPYFELVQREYEGGRDAYLLGLDEILREQRRGDENAPGKGVWVLHMLRQALGDGRFWPALERFAQEHGFDRGTPSEFLAVLGEATGEPLAPRFSPWFSHRDLPIVAAAWRWDPAGPGVTLALAQTCDPEREAPFYPITTAVLLDSPHGSRTVYVTMRERVEEFHVQAPSRPRMVIVDPSHELAMVVQASKRTEEWLEQLRRGPDALHRARAIEGLRGAWGAPDVEAALRRVVQEDPSGGVRAAAALALAPVPPPAAASAGRRETSSSEPPSGRAGSPSLTVAMPREALLPPEHVEPRESAAVALPEAAEAECVRAPRAGADLAAPLPGELVSAAPEGALPVAAEVEQLKRELRRLRAEQAQIERRLLLLELRTRPRVNEERGAPLPAEGRPTEDALPSGEPAN
jgi:hypothetical protein